MPLTQLKGKDVGNKTITDSDIDLSAAAAVVLLSAQDKLVVSNGTNVKTSTLATLLSYLMPSFPLKGSTESITGSWNFTGNVPKINNNQIWHQGNDGSGSGLDADLLDGLHAAKFVRNDSVAPADLLGLVTIVKSLQLTTAWQGTTILNTQLSTGTFAISVSCDDYAVAGNYSMTYSGIASIYASGTNATDTDEIILHGAGHAALSKRIFLRTRLNTSGVMTLEISATYNATGVSNYTFKFRRLI
jgi:hypothetical protein